MKFQKSRDGSWRAYSNPFTFWIFEHKDGYDVVCHYGDETTQSNGYFATLEDAKQHCHDFALKTTLEQLQEIAPNRAKVKQIDYKYEFVCDGQIGILAYECCLSVNHTGQCYSREKKIYFWREE